MANVQAWVAQSIYQSSAGRQNASPACMLLKQKHLTKVDAISWNSFESTSAETLCSIVRNLFFRASTSFLVGDTSSGRQQLIPERDNCFHSFKEGLHTAKNERVK
jgi:hypothetical protein